MLTSTPRIASHRIILNLSLYILKIKTSKVKVNKKKNRRKKGKTVSMYKGKRYRIGGGSAGGGGRRPEPPINTNSGISSISSVTNPSTTSTQAETISSTSSNSVNRENVPPSQPAASQAKSVIPSNDDDFAVPPSQALQPSRYISQRSARMRSQLTFTQQTPMSYFESVLNRCGVLFSDRLSDISYTLNCDHLKFVIRLRKEITSHPKYPENVQNFLSGLIDTMKTPRTLTKILSGCMVSQQIQFHCLFYISKFSFQSFFFSDYTRWKYRDKKNITRKFNERLPYDWLLTKGHYFDSHAKDKGIGSWRVGKSTSILSRIAKTKFSDFLLYRTNDSIMEIELLLTQLKFVDHLSHGEFVCEEIFDALETASDDARRIIIRSLEDIVDLTRHNDVVQKLMWVIDNLWRIIECERIVFFFRIFIRELLPEDADLLTAETIDTFGNMCLNSSTHSQICQKIIRYIKSGAPNDVNNLSF